MGIRESLAKAVPWIEPVLDYFDWKKRVVALAAGLGIAAWSFVKDLPWPVIVTLGILTVVAVAYALVFPAFIKLVHVGVQPRPNYSIWRHKKGFCLYEAAFLLADREPSRNFALINGDAAAWYVVLVESVKEGETKYVPQPDDGRHTFAGGYEPHVDTILDAAELKKFCAARGRDPEFLR
jgi:hypothetical protein